MVRRRGRAHVGLSHRSLKPAPSSAMARPSRARLARPPTDAIAIGVRSLSARFAQKFRQPLQRQLDGGRAHRCPVAGEAPRFGV